MDCPRCGTAVFADLSSCHTCSWQLSKPFNGSRIVARPEPARSPTRPALAAEPQPQPRFEAPSPLEVEAGAFALSPPATSQRAQKGGGLGRRRRRGGGGRAAARAADYTGWGGGVRSVELVDLPVVQASFDFSAAERDAEQLAAWAAAPLGARFQAGLLDGLLILLASGLFFTLFALLGGEVSLTRQELAVYLLAGFALAGLYFGLFTTLGGRTPGMQVHHLRVVSLDGSVPSRGQGLWRAFGYVVSTGSLLLGFLWSVVDERHLTWHDRISETFITDRMVL